MPVPASSILLLERDPASADLVRSALSASGSLVTLMEDAAAVIAAAADHTLVIIDVTDPATNAADVCRDLRAQSALWKRVPTT